MPEGEKIISQASFKVKIFLKLLFNNSENSMALSLKPFFKLFLIKILLALSVLSKAKLDTLVAVEEANVKASGLGNGLQPYLFNKAISSIFNLKSPPSINKYSVGFARLSTIGFQDFSNILSPVFNP